MHSSGVRLLQGGHKVSPASGKEGMIRLPRSKPACAEKAMAVQVSILGRNSSTMMICDGYNAVLRTAARSRRSYELIEVDIDEYA